MEVFFLDKFEDRSASDSEDDCEPPKKKTRILRTWLKDQELDTTKKAEDFMNSKTDWKISSTKNTSSGHRVDYRCSFGKYRSKECPAYMYLLYHSVSAKVSLYKTECGHSNHDLGCTRGLSLEMKAFIREKFNDGIVKPNGILNIMRQKNMVESTKSKLTTFLKTLRYEKYDCPTISANEIRKWCEKKRSAI